MKKSLLHIILYTSVSCIPTLSDASDASITDLSRRMSQLESQVLKLNGRLEETTNALRQAEQKLALIQPKSIGEKAPPLQPVTSLPPLPPSEKNKKKLLVNSAAEQLYDKAHSYLNLKNYDAAEDAFSQFLEKFSEHTLRLNAQYWLGETYFIQGQYEKAAISFSQAYQTYSAYKETQNDINPQVIAKAPYALAKLALCFRGLNRPKDVEATIKRFDKEFLIAPKIVYKLTEKACKGLNCSRTKPNM